MLRIKGRLYWGSVSSLDGWKPAIGSFEILDARPGFRRYIAHKKPKRLHEVITKLLKLKEYDMKCSGIIRTRDFHYPNFKYFQVFFLTNGLTKALDLKTIDKTLEDSLTKRGKIALAIQQDIPYRKSTGCIIDVNKSIKPIHTEVISDLDEIMFSKKP